MTPTHISRVTRGAIGAVLVAMAIALGCAGCGSDDGASSSASTETGATGTSTTSSTGDAAPTKAEFVREANAICKAGGDGIKAAGRVYGRQHGIAPGGAFSQAQQEDFVATIVIPALRAQAQGLAKLEAPEGDVNEVKVIVIDLENVIKTGEADPVNLLRVPKGEGPLAEVNRLAERYGIKECVQP